MSGRHDLCGLGDFVCIVLILILCPFIGWWGLLPAFGLGFLLNIFTNSEGKS
jgi:hypothetical protein